jgi:hypothetical protein
MQRFLGLGLLTVILAATAACGLALPGMGRAGGAWKPDSAMNNQFTGDIASAKVGQYVTYTTEASGQKSSNTIKVVGTSGDNTLVEQWMDAGAMSYGYLFAVGKDGKIAKAYSAAKGDTAWTEIKVNEPPKAQPAGDQPKPEVKESDEKKTVAAGDFASHRMDTTMKIQGKDYKSTTWFSADAPKLYTATDKGGLVAMESEGSKTALTAKGDDAKPTIELPAAK